MGFAIFAGPAPDDEAAAQIGTVPRKASQLGYGTDPNLVTPLVPWPRILSRRQRRLVAALSDVILPGSKDHPDPSAAGIVDFFDQWLGAPYPTQLEHRAIIIPGLERVQARSERRYGVGFRWLPRRLKRRIIDDMAASSAEDGGADRAFFVQFRYLVIGGYFTTDIGLKVIGYRGNVPLQDYLGPSAEVRDKIEAELERLGL